MKSFIISCLIAVTVLTSAVYPRKAHAIFGLASTPVSGVAVVAGVVLMVWGGGIASRERCYRVGENSYHCDHSNNGLASGLFIIGLILLDKPTESRAEFAPISAQEAIRLGVTAEQREAYLHDLPEINVVRETIQGQMVDRIRHGKQVTMKDIHAAWMDYKEMIRPDAFAVVEKISADLANAYEQASRQAKKR